MIETQKPFPILDATFQWHKEGDPEQNGGRFRAFQTPMGTAILCSLLEHPRNVFGAPGIPDPTFDPNHIDPRGLLTPEQAAEWIAKKAEEDPGLLERLEAMGALDAEGEEELPDESEGHDLFDLQMFETVAKILGLTSVDDAIWITEGSHMGGEHATPCFFRVRLNGGDPGIEQIREREVLELLCITPGELYERVLPSAPNPSLPPEAVWTVEAMRERIHDARKRYGQRFDRIADIQPRLLLMEAEAMKVWSLLLEVQPSSYTDQQDWYGPDGIKKKLTKLVGWSIRTDAGAPPSNTSEPDAVSFVMSPEYQRWHEANEKALAEMGEIATSGAYRVCYDYLKALLPLDYSANQP